MIHKPWVQIALLVAAAIIALLALGPVVGALELGVLFALVVIVSILILRRASSKSPSGT